MNSKNCLIATYFIATVISSVAADISGKVTLKGTPPKEIVVQLDPLCGKLHSADSKVTTRHFVVGQSGELADVFVYLKSEGLSNAPKPTGQTAILDQKSCLYHPYILGLQTGQTLVVKNSDPVLHNVHPSPVVDGNKEQNKAQLPKGPDLKFIFEMEEVLLKFKCDIHPWMFAYVGVLSHPYYSVTDKSGAYTIKNVPPGKYTLIALHRKSGKPLSQAITLGENGLAANFTIDAPEPLK